jgi:hypothetical protein
MQDETTTDPNQARRKFRLNLRTFMIVVLLTGSALGYFILRVRTQAAAVAAIVSVGGSVRYDGEWFSGIYVSEARPQWWVDWKLEPLGPDWFLSVKAVILSDQRRGKIKDDIMPIVASLRSVEQLILNGTNGVTDAGLTYLAQMHNLHTIDLGFSGATAASLKSVKDLTKLVKLDMPTTNVADDDLAYVENLKALEWIQFGSKCTGLTDAGLAHLRHLVNLKTVSVGGCPITSAGLEHLRDLTKLETLNFRNTQISDLAPIAHLKELRSLSLSAAPIDSGLGPINGLSKLTVLLLDKSQVTDTGVKALAGLKALQMLNLDHTQITDAALDTIGQLPMLDNLFLNHTSVTDQGLKRLAGLNKLSLLFIEGTRVTDAGIADLQKLKSCTQVAIGDTAVTDGAIKAAAAQRPKQRFVRMKF